ncbi:MAG: type II toxin-antitoxin system VapC family toxin [Bacteroidota bacterium]
MIILDTHMWIWWVDDSPQLSDSNRKIIQKEEVNGLGLSTISVWEVAKLHEKGRIGFTQPIDQWISHALEYPGIQLINLSPEISIASTQLPGDFHNDPADQIIVATANVLGVPLLTTDRRIRKYQHVKLA